MWNRTVSSFSAFPFTSTVDAVIAARGSNGTSTNGIRGTATLSYSGDLGGIAAGAPVPNVASYWNSVAETEHTVELAGDRFIITNTNSLSGWTHVYKYTGSAWASASNFVINGNQVVTGSITSDKLNVLNNLTVGGSSSFEGRGNFHDGFSSDFNGCYIHSGVTFAPSGGFNQTLHSYIALGYNGPGKSATTVSSEILIDDYGIIGIAADKNVNISSGSNVNITSDSHVVLNGTKIRLESNVSASGTITAPEFQLSSDKHVKSNIKPIENALEKALTMNGYTYNRDDLDGKLGAGIIAQELAAVLEMSVNDVDGILRVDPMGAIGLLFAALQELTEEVRTPWYTKIFRKVFN